MIYVSFAYFTISKWTYSFHLETHFSLLKMISRKLNYEVTPNNQIRSAIHSVTENTTTYKDFGKQVLTSWWTLKSFGNFGHVCNDCFDSVAFAFDLQNINSISWKPKLWSKIYIISFILFEWWNNLGLQTGHFVTIKRIEHVAVDIDRHFRSICWWTNSVKNLQITN